MTNAASLGEDAAWYIKNLPKISAFRKYLTIVETDILPESIGNILYSAAHSAIAEFDSTPALIVQTEDNNTWWFVEDGYHYESDTGAYIQAEVPEGKVDWLSAAASKQRPYLGLYTKWGPRGKAKSKEKATIITNAMKGLPKGFQRKDTFEEDDSYCIACRDLSGVITLEALQEPADLLKTLTIQMKDFTAMALPGLIALRKRMK